MTHSASTILAVLTTLLFLVSTFACSCSLGCLRCQPSSSSCLICDSTQNFYLTPEQSCSQYPNTNCLIPSPSYAQCLQCSQGHIVDQESLKCVPLPSYLTIDKCKHYSSQKKCLVCQEGFYSSGWQCLAESISVSNCEMKLSPDKCGQCKASFALSLDLNSCISHSLKNCFLSSVLDCRACSKDSFMDASAFFDSQPDSFFLFKHSWPLLEPSFRSLRSYSCRPFRSGEKCLAIDSRGRCTKCLSGLGVNPQYGTCEQVTPSIDHCLTYSSPSTCSKCKPLFFLKSSSLCERIDPVLNCSEYDSSADRSLCLLCIASHFLKTDNICSPRVASLNIDHCIAKSVQLDACETCSSGYTANQNGNKCLLSIPYCEQYHSQSGIQHLSCLKCASGFYYDLKSASCVSGKIPNCLEYSQFSTHCAQCEHGFFADNGVCVQHQYIHLCQDYSALALNKCDKCLGPHLHLEFKNVCLPYPQVQNCSTYSSGQCSTCAQGFKLSNLNCVPISLPPFCLEASSDDNCVKCQNFFFLKGETNGKNSCQISELYQRSNVAFSNPIFTSFSIQGCVANAFIDPGSSLHSRCYNNQDTSIADFSDGNSFVPNCQNYYLPSTGVIKCLQCQQGFALKENACVLDCGPNPRMFLDTPSNSKVNYITFGICDISLTSDLNHQANGVDLSDLDPVLSYSSPYCSHSSRNFADSHVSATACSKCQDLPGVFPILDIASFAGPTATITSHDHKSFHPLHRNLLGISCLKLDDVLPNVPFIVKNCALYSKVNSHYGCTKCLPGYKGTATQITIGSDIFETFLTQCDAFSECNTASLYDGKGLSTALLGPLNLPLDSAVSCFECSASSSHLIFFGKVSNKSLSPFPYSGTAVSGQLLSSGSGDPTMQCLSQSQLNTIFSSASLVSDCALYFSDVSVSRRDQPADAISSSSAAGFHCLACKDGFRPTFATNATTSLRIITSCTVISHCASASHKTFNHCSECSPGFVFPKTSDKIDLSTCVSYPSFTVDANCFAMDLDDSRCDLCQEGFSQNSEGICDVLAHPFCNSLGQFFQDPLFTSLANLNSSFPNLKDYSLYLPLVFANVRGCSSCSEGFSPLFSSSFPQKCVQSTLMASSIFTPVSANRVYISNCISLFFDNGVHKCFKCAPDFIILSDSSSCVAVTQSTAACSVLNTSDTSQCIQCLAPAVKAGHKCLTSVPSNCSQYVPNATSEILQCTKCLPGFYLSTAANTCTKGTFLYCKEYEDNSASNCTQCMESYMLVTLSTISQCLYIPHIKCLGLYKSGNNQLSCSSCPAFHLLSTVDSLPSSDLASQLLSFCFPKASIPHCTEYASGSSLSYDAPQCSKCSSDYYLSGDSLSCVRRAQFTPHCTEYAHNSETCKACESSFFLNGNQCQTMPDVAQNCRFFLDLQDCQECNQDFFLNKGRCFKASGISNCSVWQAEDQCQTCVDGFAPSYDFSSCESISTTNCLQTEKFFSSRCILCAANHQLHSDWSCVKITDINCLVLSNIETQTCSQCRLNHKLDSNKKCELISENITNCFSQLSSSTCTQCQPGFYLTKEMTQCLPMTAVLWHRVDPHCQDLREVSSPFCLVCQRGYRNPVSGECLDCKHLALAYESKPKMIQLGIYLEISFINSEGIKDYFENTCDICSQDQCLICKSGFYMDNFGFCRGDLADQSLQIISEIMTFENPYNYSLEFSSCFLCSTFVLLFSFWAFT